MVVNRNVHAKAVAEDDDDNVLAFMVDDGCWLNYIDPIEKMCRILPAIIFYRLCRHGGGVGVGEFGGVFLSVSTKEERTAFFLILVRFSQIRNLERKYLSERKFVSEFLRVRLNGPLSPKRIKKVEKRMGSGDGLGKWKMELYRSTAGGLPILISTIYDQLEHRHLHCINCLFSLIERISVIYVGYVSMQL